MNVTHGRLVQGGSTITQQVAKTLFLTNERTLRRKIKELLLTIWLERTFTKKEILEIYLNRVYLGAGTWGVDAASRMYFGISARKLNLWQSAVLAGLPRAPSRFNPRANPAAAAARAKEVLEAMAETGAITPDRARAEAAKISFPKVVPPAWRVVRRLGFRSGAIRVAAGSRRDGSDHARSAACKLSPKRNCRRCWTAQERRRE